PAQQFVFLAFCLALSCAAPGLLHSHGSSILTHSYHSLPSVRVIQPIWTTSHSVVHPISYGIGHGHGHGHGYG
ncbi:hypothetical protein KR054_007907, partial [Drosophila jambulina]